MGKIKGEVLRFTMLSKGDCLDYQTVIEEIIGPKLGKLKIYRGFDSVAKNEKEQKWIDQQRDFLTADADYEIIIVKKSKYDK